MSTLNLLTPSGRVGELLAERVWATAELLVSGVDLGERTMALARRGWFGMRRLWWRSYWGLEVRGQGNLPRRGAMLLCANHCSHLDAPAILAALPRELALSASTAAARDVFGANPLRRFVCRLTTNGVLLTREAGFPGGLRQLEQTLRQHRPLVIFPEGRRSSDGELLEFHGGAAMLAQRTGAPIVPIRIDGLRQSLPKGSALPKPSRVRVRFGRAIHPTYMTDKRDAYRRMIGELREAIDEMAETLDTEVRQ